MSEKLSGLFIPEEIMDKLNKEVMEELLDKLINLAAERQIWQIDAKMVTSYQAEQYALDRVKKLDEQIDKRKGK